ncbi:hypothetical protein PSTT_16836, partial [Puccinia striiformis]
DWPPNGTNLNPDGLINLFQGGIAKGLGIKRAREMRALCWVFGIYSKHCMVLDHPDLPDSMLVWWPEKTILEFVKLYIDLWNTGADIYEFKHWLGLIQFLFIIIQIITFNHHGAIASALSEPQFPMMFMLRSRSLIEKYTSIILSVPFSLYRHNRNHESFLPELTHPKSHPTRDKKHLANIVVLIFKPTKYYKAEGPSISTFATSLVQKILVDL